jgi:hypothetical protein
MIEANVTLTPELYQVIEQQALGHGRSVSDEITSIVTASLRLSQNSLTEEFEAWEAASDEDWLKMEKALMAEAQP